MISILEPQYQVSSVFASFKNLKIEWIIVYPAAVYIAPRINSKNGSCTIAIIFTN